MTVLGSALSLLWHALRIPALAALPVFEPVARLGLTSGALASLCTALVIESSAAAPRFPFWSMVGASIGSAVLLMLYEALIGWLTE